jgi:hypothetical protein
MSGGTIHWPWTSFSVGALHCPTTNVHRRKFDSGVFGYLRASELRLGRSQARSRAYTLVSRRQLVLESPHSRPSRCINPVPNYLLLSVNRSHTESCTLRSVTCFASVGGFSVTGNTVAHRPSSERTLRNAALGGRSEGFSPRLPASQSFAVEKAGIVSAVQSPRSTAQSILVAVVLLAEGM